MALALNYLPNGNIQYKSDAGVYNYVSFPAHEVKTINEIKPELMNSGNQQISYTAFHKADTIHNDSNQRLVIAYGVDQQRIRTRFYDNNQLQKTKYFAASYEKEDASGNTCEINYISTPYGTLAAYIVERGRGQMYYLYKDHLGSITTITNATGTIVERRSFDAWGRLRNPDNWTYTNIPTMTILERGYTGHEHLFGFGLINMNGRMYDPLIGQMLSPDPYVPNASNSQDFNRYTYARNNPLLYVDPDGEFIWAVAAFIIVGGYKVLTNNWQGEASAKQTIMAGIGALFMPAGAVSGANLLKFGVQQVGNTLLSQYVSINIPISENSSISLSPGLGFNPASGLSWGANASFNSRYVSLAVGGGTNHVAVGGSVTFDNGLTLGYYATFYGSKQGPDGKSNKQLVGGVSASYKDFSVRFENDFLAFQGKDRWRTNAFEIQYKNFVFGTSVYTNDPEGEGSDKDYEGTDLLGNRNKKFNGKEYGAWEEGQVYLAPLWFGYRDGNNVIRAGVSDRMVQDRTQNWVHRNGFLYLPFVHQNFYNKYDYMYEGPYNYSGYYNPFSLW